MGKTPIPKPVGLPVAISVVPSSSTKHLLEAAPALAFNRHAAPCAPDKHLLDAAQRADAAAKPSSLKPNLDLARIEPKDGERPRPEPDEGADGSPSTGHLIPDDDEPLPDGK